MSELERGLPPEPLLIVRDLDDQWHIKGILEPFGEHERYQVPKMQGF